MAGHAVKAGQAAIAKGLDFVGMPSVGRSESDHHRVGEYPHGVSPPEPSPSYESGTLRTGRVRCDMAPMHKPKKP